MTTVATINRIEAEAELRGLSANAKNVLIGMVSDALMAPVNHDNISDRLHAGQEGKRQILNLLGKIGG